MAGLGASAGGLKALTLLLDDLPADIGMGFVVIQHLDPHHDIQLTALLTSHCRFPVSDAMDDTAVLPNHAYVIPANAQLTIEQGPLHVTTRANGIGAHHPIAAFFLLPVACP